MTLEDWNAVSKQRVIDDYLREHKVYCEDCDNYSGKYCEILHTHVEPRFSCDFGARKVEHVGRSNDSTGTVNNPVEHSSVADQPLICSHPCMDSTCKHHPISAPIDGTECRYIDLFRTDGCERK